MEVFDLPADFSCSCLSPTPSQVIESSCALHFVLPKVLIVLPSRLFHNTVTLWNVEGTRHKIRPKRLQIYS